MSCERTLMGGKATLAIAAVLGGVISTIPPVARGSDEAPADKLTENWSQTVVFEGRLAPLGQCRLWVQDGWLIVERRSIDDEVEWKVVLAKVEGDELPKVVADREVEKYVKELHFEFPFAIDDGETARRYVASFPSYFLVHGDGNVAIHKRSLPSASDMLRFMEPKEADE